MSEATPTTSLDENGTAPPINDPNDYWEYHMTQIIWKYFSPILIVLGTIFNATTIAVLTKRKFGKPSTRILLISLAVCDTFVLYTGLLRHWIRMIWIDVRTLSPVSCPLHVFLVYFSLDFSTWILSLVTIERFVSVCFPFKARHLCSERWTMGSLLSVAVLLFIFNGHILFNYGLVNGECSSTSPQYYKFWSGPWYWMDLVAIAGLPITLIVTCNTFIIYKVTFGKFHKQSQVHPMGGTTHHASKVTSMTVMLLTINITFVILVMPSCIYFIVSPKATDFHHSIQISLAFTLTNFLLYINNTINFLMYCISAPKFRKELVGLVCRRHRPDRDTSVTLDPRRGQMASRTNVSVILPPPPVLFNEHAHSVN